MNPGGAVRPNRISSRIISTKPSVSQDKSAESAQLSTGVQGNLGAWVRYDPDAGGLVCAVCGQEEPDELPGILGQLLGDQEDASRGRAGLAIPAALRNG